MEFMRDCSDNSFDLAIVDPPYGIGYSGRDGQNTIKYDNKKKWDNERPTQEYFNELFRVSKNQIIWGANYFIDMLKPSKGIICWFKHQNGNFSEWELAWTNIGNAKHFDRPYQKDLYNKIHPTQKPIFLYRWLLQQYSNEGDLILDTNGGSATIAIACDLEKRKLDICEIDKDYFEASKKRFELHKDQLQLF